MVRGAAFASVLVAVIVGLDSAWEAWKDHQAAIADRASQSHLVAEGGHRVACQHDITATCAAKAARSAHVAVAWIQSTPHLRPGALLVRQGNGDFPVDLGWFGSPSHPATAVENLASVGEALEVDVYTEPVGSLPNDIPSRQIGSLAYQGSSVSIETEIPAAPQGRAPLPLTEAWAEWTNGGVAYGVEVHSFDGSSPVSLLQGVLSRIQYALT